ncbi:PD40 domain-containing protein [Bdellovibrio sp. NC01]|uniref:TolB family protein n=1 Tax=Bdellovibrio sp. NC01 TaxID=2220073 RepID=UPI00115BBDB5|nr:PD40 domain-containing protein [Bdellovibrio sp. NC01]QDK39145.1 hypothetical protein DOE51_16895 [Bdellovibrio sp. NC01]
MKWNWKIVTIAGVLCGCSHLSVTKDLLTPDYLLTKGTKQITFQGDNEHPRFSPDGTKLIFASRNRPTHKGSQIYEVDLTRNKERRVTFSDGDAFDPGYVSDSEILYASTTDEIKESPFINKNYNKDFPPSDLYMSDRFGGEIVRLTNAPGFDAEPTFVQNPTKPFILYTTYRNEVMGVSRMDLQKLMVTVLSADPEKERRFPAITSDHKQIAFLEKDKKTSEQSLVLYNIKTKKSEVLKSGEGQYRDLIFTTRSPARLFYSVLRKGEKQYQIESYDLDDKCTQVVFKGADSLTHPVISDDSNERLVFARNFQGKKQLYMVNLPEDLGPCLEQRNPGGPNAPSQK